MSRRMALSATLLFLVGCLGSAIAQEQQSATSTVESAAAARKQEMALSAPATPRDGASGLSAASASSHSAKSSVSNDQELRLEGEKRFRTNCGRCHVAPPKFPPRAMTTILRHMRVRALITDEDRRLILRYMTE